MRHSDFRVDGPINVHLQHGRVVVKGSSDSQRGRLIGHARITQKNGGLKIDARGSLVLSVPRNSELSVHGHVHDAVLKSLRHVKIEKCNGNLSAKDIGTLQIQGPVHGNATLRTLDGDVRTDEIMGHLLAKRCKNLHLQRVAGHATLKQVENLSVESEVMGDLTIKQGQDVQAQRVRGNVTLKQVGNVYLEEVSGNLTVSNSNEISVQRTRGNATLKHVAGSVKLNVVEGNLIINMSGPSLMAAQVRGNVHLIGTLHSGGEYTIRANGDVSAKVDGNVHFSIHSDGHVEVGEGVEKEDGENGTIHVYQGSRDNAAHVTIRAEGNVCINSDQCSKAHDQRAWDWHDYEWDWDDEREVEVEFDVEGEVRRAMDELFSEVKKASHTVREEFERAFRDVERTTEGPIGSFIRHAVQDLFAGLRPSPPPPPPKPEEPVSRPSPDPSSDELKMILRMVANGSITAEEAERLIQAMQ